jgi:hypothetical protein
LNQTADGNSTYVLDFRSGKASEGVCTVRGGDESSLSKVVLGLEISHLGVVGPVDNADRDREDGIALLSN